MNRFLIYILGIITGVGLTFGFAYFTSGEKELVKDDGITLFETPGETFNVSAFKVIQVVDDAHALAIEMRWEPVFKDYMQEELVVLLTNDSGEYYYDDQMIKTPKGKAMKQVGVYKYETRAGIAKTVPIVKLMDK